MFDIGTMEVKAGDDYLFTATNLQLADRGIYLLLGPNGSGKTSFIRTLSKKIISGRHLVQRHAIGHIAAMSSYDRSIPLKGKNFFRLYNQTPEWPYDFKSHFEYLKEKPISEMSHGEFQSLVLVSQLCSNKKIYLFDEPFSHLNPAWTRIFIPQIEHLSQESVFLIVSHHLEEFRTSKIKRLLLENNSLREI